MEFQARPSQQTQTRIDIARVICIFFMVYSHVNPIQLEFAPDLYGIRLFDYARWWLVTVFSMASVALLSAISGYLVVSSLKRYEYADFVWRRIKGLVVPLILWNLVFIVFFLGADIIKPGNSADTLGPLSLQRLPDLLIGITTDPANIPVGFFRDVFVCMLVAPLIITAMRKGTLMMAGLVILFYIVGLYSPFLLRPNLIVFFAIGMYFAGQPDLPKISASVSAISWAITLALGLVIVQLKFADPALGVPGSDPVIDVARVAIRFPAIIAFWSLVVGLSKLRFGRELTPLNSYMFFTFCAHTMILPVLWTIWQVAFEGYYHPAYPIFFLASPVAVFAIAILGAKAMNQLTPNLFKVMNGGRRLQLPDRSPQSGEVRASAGDRKALHH